MKTATLWLVTLFLGSFRTSHAPSPPTLLLHLTELCYYPNVNVDRLTGDYNRFVFKGKKRKGKNKTNTPITCFTFIFFYCFTVVFNAL